MIGITYRSRKQQLVVTIAMYEAIVTKNCPFKLKRIGTLLQKIAKITVIILFHF